MRHAHINVQICCMAKAIIAVIGSLAVSTVLVFTGGDTCYDSLAMGLSVKKTSLSDLDEVER